MAILFLLIKCFFGGSQTENFLYICKWFYFMHVIARPQLIAFWEKHPNAETPLKTWFGKVKQAKWKNYHEIKQDFPSADQIGNDRIVFDIKGNDYRMICLVFISGQKVFIRFIGTHAEYDKLRNANNI
jgi:mRNA interferase HigB